MVQQRVIVRRLKDDENYSSERGSERDFIRTRATRNEQDQPHGISAHFQQGEFSSIITM